MSQQKEQPKQPPKSVVKEEKLKNPGIMLDLNEKCISTFPVFFDGLRVMVHRGLSRHFRVTHNIYLSSITPGNYRFGATYVGSKELKEHEGYPVLLGDIDSHGNMNASMYHVFGKRLKVRLDSQMENHNFVSSQLSTHYFGNTFTASALIVNPDILSSSGCLLLQYLQSVTSKLALGVELAFMRNMLSHKKPSETPNSFSQVSLMGRYATPHSSWSAVLSLHNVLVDCYKKASEQIEFGIEMNTNFRTCESVGTLAFQVRLPDRGILFKGSVDTNTNVGSVFEKKLCNTPFAIAVSTNLNYRTNNFRLGLGFIVE